MKLIYYPDRDLYDALGGKGNQASIRIHGDGRFEVVGDPIRPRAHGQAVGPASQGNASYLLGRHSRELLLEKAAEARAACVLSKVKDRLGRYRWRTAIWTVWQSGDYENAGLGDLAQELQQIRNTLGPAWLSKARLP